MKIAVVALMIILGVTTNARAQDKEPGEFFFSWGYNGDRYARSDMHFQQSDLGNDFTLHGVHASDEKGWTDLFHHSLTVPEYNVRLGYFFNARWGIELAIDHIKWVVDQDQQVRITGTLGGAPVDRTTTLTTDVLRYKLNNGANPVFINVIRRMAIAGEPGHTGNVSLLVKAGAGFAVPHTENAVFDQPNKAGFQWFHGWDTDVAVAARINLFKRVYLELEDKLLYAGYRDININHGIARHSVKGNEMSFSFGLGLPN